MNATGPSLLALAARRVGASLVHISTDYVFNGRKENDYDEEDEVDPVNIYGASKLEGEVAVREVLERHYIIRTAWLFGKAGRNFVDTMLPLFRGRPTVQVVRDQIGNPTYAVDLAQAIMAIISAKGRKYGTYNYTNEGEASWYSFAQAIHQDAASFGLVDRHVEILPITSDEYPSRALRPRKTCLSKARIKREFGLSIRGWREALRSYLQTKALIGSSHG